MSEETQYSGNLLRFPTNGLNSGGGGGTFDGMEHRVARLETDMRELLAELKGIRSDLASVRVDLSEMKGRLGAVALAADLAEVKGRVSNLPTIVNLIAMVVGIVVPVMGGAFAIAKYAMH